MAWRPMRSLAELDNPAAGLRGQVNAIAPGRSKASDGLVGDQNHGSTSGHFPHTVPGVGTEIVTAWDVTNDPAGGCDSFALCEVLRRHRDKRLRYVISNRQIFSSYATATRKAWEWGPYSGTSDPHVNHGHIQVLDEPISDTSAPWNLQGFGSEDSMADSKIIYNTGVEVESGVIGLHDPVVVPRNDAVGQPGTTISNALAKSLRKIDSQAAANSGNLSSLLAGQSRIEAALARIEAKVDKLIATPPAVTVLPSTVTIADGEVTWS